MAIGRSAELDHEVDDPIGDAPAEGNVAADKIGSADCHEQSPSIGGIWRMPQFLEAICVEYDASVCPDTLGREAQWQ